MNSYQKAGVKRMKNSIKEREKGRMPRYACLLSCVCTLLCGLLSYSPDLLFLFTYTASVALQAVLLRFSRPWPCLLLTPAAMVISYAVTSSYMMLFPLFAILPAALVLARSTARGEGRCETATSLTGVYAVFGLAALALMLLVSLNGDVSDLPAVLERMLAEAVDGIVTRVSALHAEAVALYAEMGVQIAPLAAADLREMLVMTISLLPGAFFALAFILSLVTTYLYQLCAMFAGAGLFTLENLRYKPSAWLAGAYIVSAPISFFGGNFRHAFCLVCMNFAVFAMPLFVFGVCRLIPRLLSFMRRVSFGKLDFIFFAVLFFLFALSYALYALPALAFLYACYILKGTLFPRQKREKK